jgi:hypothetical protein
VSYQLAWKSDTLESLAALWIIAPDRNAVARAVHLIEQALAADPTQGSEVSEGLYKLGISPVTLYYEIDSANAIVAVTGVALIEA